MRVKVFMNSASTNHERDILRLMHDGIKQKVEPQDKKQLKEWKKINKQSGRAVGVDFDYSEKYTDCDVAVMFGSWKPGRSNIHHIVRSSIAEKAKSFICIETPLLGRTISDEHKYYRIGVNGFLNRDGYFGEDVDRPNDRLSKLGISFPGWKLDNGKKIVMALQLAGDASLRHNDINQWCWDTLHTLRRFTDRPIEVRTHPAMSAKGWGNHDEMFRDILFSDLENISFVDGRKVTWQQQIQDAYCVVSYSSGLAIDAVINGIPVLSCDEGNFTYHIGDNKLSNIESLNLVPDKDVVQWLNNLAYCQWTTEEMEKGIVWDHLKSGIESIVKEWYDNQE